MNFQQIWNFFSTDRGFFTIILIAVFIIPNAGSNFFDPTSPLNLILNKCVLAMCLHWLIELFGVKDFRPYIAFALVMGSIVFLPSRIFELKHFVHNTTIVV